MVTGTWDYNSGIAHATHFTGNALVPPDEPVSLAVVIPREQVTVLADWGDGVTLGMNSSGSDGVRVENVFVPARCASVGNWTRVTGATPGTRLHANPMYLGPIYAVYHAGLVIPLIGAGRASLTEYEQILLTRQTLLPPQDALALLDSAEAIVIRVGERYMELCRRWAETGELFSREDDVRNYAMVQQAEAARGRGGAGHLQRRQLVGREARAAAAALLPRRLHVHGHVAAQYLNTAGELARVHFDQPDGLF